MSFVFYDCETTGTHRSFDQILQFAALRTDDRLDELDAFDIRCRLLPEIVPSLTALQVNRVTARQLTDKTLPSHYEMVTSIQEKLRSWSPAIFVGYNSLMFDEHLLRQAFYKTLHPPYLTNTNGNIRCDAMRLIQAASLFAPQAVVLPVAANAERTFRLDRIAMANGINHEGAHDAMADVKATLHLCRRLLNRAPDLWSSAIRLCGKSEVLHFVAIEPVFCLTDFYFGRPYSRIVSAMGYNDKNTNEVYLYNLTFPLEYISSLGEARLRLRLPTRPKPVHVMRANALPMMVRLEDAPRFAQGLAVGRDELRRRSETLQSDPGLRRRLIAAYEAVREQHGSSPHVEERIYERFISEADDRLMKSFHAAPWEHRPSIVDRFDDERLRDLGYRLIHSERPDLLDQPMRQAHSESIARRLLAISADVPWLTLREAIQVANDLLKKAKGPDREFIRDHRVALEHRLAEAVQFGR